MPLHDHFHPPWSIKRPWEGFHGAWAANIAFHLNSGVLPEDYYAMPMLQVGGRVEVDVGTFREGGSGAATAVWAPPCPTLTIPLEAAHTDSFEVQVLRNLGGPQLRAAVELVSPSNKDGPASRRAFAAKCTGYLRRDVAVVVIDIVTQRQADLFAEILDALDQPESATQYQPSQLFAASYHSVDANEASEAQIWFSALSLGSTLPELPLWLERDLSVPLPLEESYAVTCGSLRMRN